jgi:hypothetical protein
MNAIPIASILRPQLDRVFSLAGSLVRDCTYYKTSSHAGTGLLDMAAMSVPVKAILTPYQSQDIDGSAVLLGDEKCFIRANDLAAITNPTTGDYLTDMTNGQSHQVIASRLEPSGCLWLIQVRRLLVDDWGDLMPAYFLEDWGDLSATTLFDDLNS